MCTARVFVQGMCIQYLLRPLPRFGWAFPVLVVGLAAVGGVVAAAVASSSGLGRSAVLRPLFPASGIGAGVGSCVFGCGLVLLPSLALFVGLHLDLGLCCAWSGKKIGYT